MAYIDLALRDLRRWTRGRSAAVAPGAAGWHSLHDELRYAPRGLFYYPGSIAYLGFRYGYWAVPKWYWWEQLAVFWLPSKPAGCYRMQWLVAVTGQGYDVRDLGRPCYDLGSFANVTGKGGLRAVDTPLWRTWDYARPIELVPSLLWPGPAAVPVRQGGECNWRLVSLAVRYFY